MRSLHDFFWGKRSLWQCPCVHDPLTSISINKNISSILKFFRMSKISQCDISEIITHTCTYIYALTYIHLHIHTWTYKLTHTHLHIHTSTYTPPHTHLHIHSSTYTQNVNVLSIDRHRCFICIRNLEDTPFLRQVETFVLTRVLGLIELIVSSSSSLDMISELKKNIINPLYCDDKVSTGWIW